jgi:hypothetical protein
MQRALAGHSLGGAVAALSTLRLLATHTEASSFVSCITFACVALGNQDVSRTVQANGWSHMFHNFILPGAIVAAKVHGCITDAFFFQWTSFQFTTESVSETSERFWP